MQMRRLWFVVFIGFAGTACLLFLGKWQVDRLYWKLDVLSKIEQKISATAVKLPNEPSERNMNTYLWNCLDSLREKALEF